MYNPTSSETFISIVNYTLQYFSYSPVNSVDDTVQSRLVAEEVRRAYTAISKESDWQEQFKDTRLDSLEPSVSPYVSGGATGYELTGSTSRIDSVWDTFGNVQLRYLDYADFQRLSDTWIIFATCDNDWLTCDNDFSGFREHKLPASCFTFYNNSLFLNPNVSDVSNIKVTHVVKPSLLEDSYDRFELSQELMDVLKCKILATSSIRFDPSMYERLEYEYQNQVRASRQRLNHYPTRARRSVL
jgi:hypothetical protein